jgi:hypothetical protein
MKKPLSPQWTAEDRLRVVAAFLPDMQDDIYAGKYSAPGRPNVTSLQHIIHETVETLEAHREDLEAAVEKYEAQIPSTN